MISKDQNQGTLVDIFGSFIDHIDNLADGVICFRQLSLHFGAVHSKDMASMIHA